MIKVSKEESIALRERFPDLCIAILNKRSRHKKYYVEETPRVLKFINKYRGQQICGSRNKGGLTYRSQKA